MVRRCGAFGKAARTFAHSATFAYSAMAQIISSKYPACRHARAYGILATRAIFAKRLLVGMRPFERQRFKRSVLSSPISVANSAFEKPLPSMMLASHGAKSRLSVAVSIVGGCFIDTYPSQTQ